jgi:hemerythrin-like domain-containing protein
MAALESDHETAGRDHENVDALGRTLLETGELDPMGLREMKRTLQRLSQMYARHIAVEDGELFPMAARVLPADALAQVGREMAERRGAILKI